MKQLTKRERQIAYEEKKKKIARKDKSILIIGVLIFIMALFQLFLVGYYLLNSSGGYNQIVIHGDTITTEVCEMWFNSSMQYSAVDPNTPIFYNHNGNQVAIPMDVVAEVCDKWKEVQKEIKFENG